MEQIPPFDLAATDRADVSTDGSLRWWHDLKPHPLLEYVPRHSSEELDDLEERVRSSGRIREPIRLVVDRETGERKIVDGMGRWQVGKRTDIEPPFEDLGHEDEIDVAAVILDYGTRRNLSAAQKVQMYLNLHERSDDWRRRGLQAQARANAARSERARRQPRGTYGYFEASPTGAASGETRPVHRERDRIAVATGTSPATVARVLAARRGAGKPKSSREELRHLLGAARKSLGLAAAIAASLDWSELAGDIEKLRREADLVCAKVEAQRTAPHDGAC